VFRISVQLSNPLLPVSGGETFQLGVQVDNQAGESLISNFAYVGALEALVSQDLRNPDKLPTLDVAIGFNADNTRVDFDLTLPDDYEIGDGAQVSAFTTSTDGSSSFASGTVGG
jgi:hypothetical protein